MSEKEQIKVAVIDMNNGFPNQGMRGIQELLNSYSVNKQPNLIFKLFEFFFQDLIFFFQQLDMLQYKIWYIKLEHFYCCIFYLRFKIAV